MHKVNNIGGEGVDEGSAKKIGRQEIKLDNRLIDRGESIQMSNVR